MWRFQSYISEEGVDELLRWYDGQVPSVQQEFVTTAFYLRTLSADAWIRPDYDDLTKKEKLLEFGEIRVRVEVDGLIQQHRILGFRDIDAMVFTTVTAVHKTSRFHYDRANLVARKQQIDSDPMKFTRNSDWIFDL